MAAIIPKWHNELDIFRRIKPLIILEGNVFDHYLYPGDEELPEGSIVRLPQYLHSYLRSCGYRNIVFYDGIRCFENPYSREDAEAFAKMTGGTAVQGKVPVKFAGGNQNASVYVRTAMGQTDTPSAVVMDFASRYVSDPGNLSQEQVESFTELLKATLEGKEVKAEGGMLRNLCILLVNKVNDLPAWVYLGNPNVKTVLLRTPGKEERMAMISGDGFRAYFKKDIYDSEIGDYEGREEELEKIRSRFVGLTEGFSFTEMNGLRQLSKNQGIHIRDLCSVIDFYKFGIRENPWDKLDLSGAREDLEKRVKGQETALTQVLDVVKRAVTGMADITSSTHGKPKGVLFFAGPTGTGKTETAKALAEKIFGDESACIRFDMSEFGQAHSDQRLLGAPPGYVGYESGGQLTNAVKNNPFSILLFDEIEKAHPSILDKFLQILEDGRMTDGKGETVYFSECIIIFTSNLGIYEPGTDGRKIQRVSSAMSYDEVRDNVREGIENYFKQQLGRPEILNRIGENIVVFDFIRKDVAEKILKAQIKKIIGNMLTARNIELEVSEEAYGILLERALANLDNGGRGIGNIVESMFVNPVSRYMFDENHLRDCRIRVEGLQTEVTPYSAVCSAEDR